MHLLSRRDPDAPSVDGARGLPLRPARQEAERCGGGRARRGRRCGDAPRGARDAISGMGGLDFAFEVVGTQKTVEQALASTRRGAVVGVCPSGTRISVDPTMLLQQRVLTGTSFGGGHQRKDVPDLIDLYMSGKYQLKEMVSRRLPLSALNHPFDRMRQGEVKRSVIIYESQSHDNGPAAQVRRATAGSTYRKYASPAAFGRRLAAGPFSTL